MRKPSFEEMYMRLANEVARRSHCVKVQVGSVLTKDTRVVSTGYNGPPKGTYNCDEKWPKEGCPRSLRGGCSLSLHAEANAILYALRHGVNLADAVLYVTLAPCLPCSRMLFNVGIRKVFYQDSYAKFKGLKEEEGVIFLRHFGVEVTCYQCG